MSVVRSGMFATLDGRTFPVRAIRTTRYREIVDGRMVEPDLSPDEFSLLVSVATTGRVLGHSFDITSAPGDELEVYGVAVPPEVRERMHLEGNPYDGWHGRVPADQVEELSENVRVLRDRRNDREDER